jgi:hypothetical protein
LRELERLTALARTRFVSTYDLAAVHANVGSTDRAFEYLHAALQERAQMLGFLKWDPAFDPIRADPRMDVVMHQLAALKPVN